jgi:FixJ family two-component response regulator
MSRGEAIVFVVDDDESLRTSTARLVRASGFQVETFASAREFLDHPRPDAPACLVLDLRLRGESGLDLQRQLSGSAVAIPIIFVTGHGDIPTTVRAMKAGAVEFLTKPYRKQALLDAIRMAIERDRSARQERSETSARRERYEQLTGREREVLAFVVAGLSNKQIAGELGTSERTVKFHRAHIMQKMDAASIAELVRVAGELGVAGKG